MYRDHAASAVSVAGTLGSDAVLNASSDLATDRATGNRRADGLFNRLAREPIGE